VANASQVVESVVIGAIAQRMVDTLSFLITTGSNSSTLSNAGSVLDQLMASQAISLVANGEHAQSITSSSANISMLVSVTPAGSSQLTTQPLTVPGCASSFEPMPADLLPTGVGIVTSFFALTFDPHAGVGGLNITGVTRLAFSYTDGTPLEVSNASSPIRFTLPAVDTAGGEQAACMFWDVAAGVYSGVGCIGLPAPYPANHSVMWLDNFTAHSDADLALSWNISGPMVEDASCFTAVLDCVNDVPGPYFVDHRTSSVEVSNRPGEIFPDPYDPLGVPAISCGNGSAGRRTMRIYYGHFCPLWQDNEYNCSWDNAKQSFVGGGCVSNGPTKCMCRHLTDFASARVPKISTCSVSDMTSLNPNDLITKLKFLFQLVVVLFGVMNVGAVIGAYMDMSQRKSTLLDFQRPEMGFTEHPDGELWTWRCVHEPLTSAVGPPSGTAVHIARALGMPFVRLRAALPEALISGSTGHALGRQVGLSVVGLETAHEENMAVMTALRQSFSCFGGKQRDQIPEFGVETEALELQAAKNGAPERIPAFNDSAERVLATEKPKAAEVAAANHDEVAERMVGTALVLAFMANAKTLKVTELARRVAAASAHFRGVTVQGIDHDWDWLYSCYLLMLSPGNLSSRSGWLDKSRLWRFLMMQRTDGSWPADASVAFALQAHDERPDKPPPPKTQNKFLLLLGSLLGGDDDAEELFEDTLADAAAEERASRMSAVPAASKSAGGENEAPPSDCPLTFSHAALLARLPSQLATLNIGFHRRQEEQARQAALLAQQEAELEAARAAARAARSEETAALATLTSDLSVAGQLAALLQVGTAQSLHALLDYVVEKLQRELADIQRAMAVAQRSDAAALQRARRSDAVRRLQRAKSRRLERMVSLRMALPPAQPSEPEPVLEPEPEPVTPAPTHTDSNVFRLPGPRRDRRGPVPAERIWATVLSVQALRELDASWLIDDEAEVVRTIVDAGYEFLHAQARVDHRVRRLLKSGALFDAARRARRAWAALQRSAVGQLRDADVITSFTALTHVQRASARVVRSMCTDHSTFSTFLDVDGYIMRWQRFMILLTLVLSTLLVSIWFYCAYPCGAMGACARRTQLLTHKLAHRLLRLARRAMLRGTARHFGVRPGWSVPRLRRRLRRLPDAVRQRGGTILVFQRGGRPAHAAHVLGRYVPLFGLCSSQRAHLTHAPFLQNTCVTRFRTTLISPIKSSWASSQWLLRSRLTCFWSVPSRPPTPWTSPATGWRRRLAAGASCSARTRTTAGAWRTRATRCLSWCFGSLPAAHPRFSSSSSSSLATCCAACAPPSSASLSRPLRKRTRTAPRLKRAAPPRALTRSPSGCTPPPACSACMARGPS
jgi:hypothetical protein